MIISHKHKFIFIKTAKTAGTSIEIALSKFCGPDDIITPIVPEDEDIRQSLGYRGPQNYLLPLRKYGIKDLLKRIIRGEKKLAFYHHIAAEDVIAQIGQGMWDDYYTFCVERNPWDRMISLYYWNHKEEPRPSIHDFVRSEEPLVLKRRGYDCYVKDSNIVVDKVCRYETLAADLEEVRKRIGIPEPLVLPRAKSKYRKDKRSYREILGEDDRDFISRLFDDEIRLMDYQW